MLVIVLLFNFKVISYISIPKSVTQSQSGHFWVWKKRPNYELLSLLESTKFDFEIGACLFALPFFDFAIWFFLFLFLFFLI